MTELVAVIVTALVVAGLLALVTARAEMIQRRFEQYGAYVSVVIILGVMVYVLAEVVMRSFFNAPLQGHLEGSELLLPMIVFFAVSYTQARDGHVGMTLVVDSMPPNVRKVVDFATLVVSMMTCAVMAYFGAKQAFNAWEIDDVTMTPPYWRIWPSSAIIPFGYLMLSVRMCLQAMQIVMPERFPEPVKDEFEIHATE